MIIIIIVSDSSMECEIGAMKVYSKKTIYKMEIEECLQAIHIVIDKRIIT
jgi:hypothetical protein